MEAADKKRTGLLVALGVCVLVCVFLLGREVVNEGPIGESKNPNFGHASVAAKGPTQGRSTPGGAGANDKDQYYKNLKFNRPDLSEGELQEKTEHWWKVKNGEAKVTGG